MWKSIINSHLFTIIYPLVLGLSLILGAGIARKSWLDKKIIWKSSGVEGAVIAIFSLLLSFTFFASNNLMRDRLLIIYNMRDATANLRRMSAITNESIKEETKIYLIKYMTIMIDFKSNYLASEDSLRGHMEAINFQYLTALAFEAKKDTMARNDVLVMMPYLNQLNTSFYRLIDSYDERTPPLIIILLVLSSLLIGILVGFLNSFNNRRHYMVPIIFLVIVSLCIQCIRNLDNPYIGTIQPKFTDFEHQLQILQRTMHP
jgi:hypothetical protein